MCAKFNIIGEVRGDILVKYFFCSSHVFKRISNKNFEEYLQQKVLLCRTFSKMQNKKKERLSITIDKTGNFP